MNILRLIPRNKPRTGLCQADVLSRIDEDVRAMIGRNRFMGDKLEIGPNWVHAVVGRGPSGLYGEPGTFEDLGWAKNLKTTVGMDWLHEIMGGKLPLPAAQNAPATVVTATAVTGTGTTWTASQLIGMRIVAPVTGITTAPVIGNILSNTTSVAQIDQWWKGDDTTGTTPANSNSFVILPGQGPARFMALTTNTGGPAVGDVALTGEFTTLGLNRALATFAHTGGQTTYTQYKIWTSTGDSGAIHKAGLFTGGYGASGGGVDVANTNLNADATLANNDTLAVTWTWTLPAAG
jgi:hypothetical protein